MAGRDVCVETLVSRASATRAGECSGRVALVKHDNLRQRHVFELLGEERGAGFLHIGPLLFGGDQRLFFSDSFICRSVDQSAPALIDTPSADLHQKRNSSSVASGCRPTCAAS